MAPFWAHKWIALGVTIAIFAALQLRRRAPLDLLFLGGLVIVTLSGVITPKEAVQGFSARAVLAIAAFLAVAAGLRSCGVLDWVGNVLLGEAKTETGGLTRLAAAIVPSSAFLLNTALVAMMAPVLVDWCRRTNISPSKMMIPLSYLAMLGGVCTLIGTSTTLIVNGEMHEHHSIVKNDLEKRLASDELSAAQATAERTRVDQVRPMSLFELGKVGLPIAIIGSLYMLLIGRRLLPNRTDILMRLGDQRREYLVEMMVADTCRLIGQTVQKAGLRNLPGLFLIEIDRDGEVITPVSPEDRIESGDRLVFTGVVETIVDLENIPGLVPVADLSYAIDPEEKSGRHLTEVVLSPTSPLIGETVKRADFRNRYNAAVVAVHRNGVRITNKVGDIILEPGDTLLLQTSAGFVSRYRNSREFYLVSEVEGSAPRQHHKTRLATVLFLSLVVWLVVGSFWDPEVYGWAAPEIAAITIAVGMIVTRCLKISVARSAIDVSLFVTIAAALGVGAALESSGAARMLAETAVSLVNDNPWVLLIVIYLMTMILTEMITNNAVAILMFPIAINVAEISGHSPRPFIMAIALAASLAFMTPIGYQTNLMVMGPGGYRPLDYLKCGLPLSCCVGLTAIWLIPFMWPF